MTAQAHRMGHDSRVNLRYLAETIVTVGLLAATTIFARRTEFPHDTPLYTAIQLLPVIPVWLLVWANVRHYRRLDELQRLLFLQAIALTAGILIGIAWSWPAIQRAFALQPPFDGMWEVYGSVVYVVITAFVNVWRGTHRAG